MTFNKIKNYGYVDKNIVSCVTEREFKVKFEVFLMNKFINDPSLSIKVHFGMCQKVDPT